MYVPDSRIFNSERSVTFLLSHMFYLTLMLVVGEGFIMMLAFLLQ
jgi:hypothetical protein